VGDTWRPLDRVQLTFGARGEATRFDETPARNPEIERLFGFRTDFIPSELHVSPRLGFSWRLNEQGTRCAWCAAAWASSAAALLLPLRLRAGPDGARDGRDAAGVRGRARAGAGLGGVPARPLRHPHLVRGRRRGRAGAAPSHGDGVRSGVRGAALVAGLARLPDAAPPAAERQHRREPGVGREPVRRARPQPARRRPRLRPRRRGRPPRVRAGLGHHGDGAGSLLRLAAEPGALQRLRGRFGAGLAQHAGDAGLQRPASAADLVPDVVHLFARARPVVVLVRRAALRLLAADHGGNPNVREWSTSDLERRHSFVTSWASPLARRGRSR
jgi:hypothetical protein